MTEALEKRRRDAMSGYEAWRDGGTAPKDSNKDCKDSNKDSNKNKAPTEAGKELEDVEMNIDANDGEKHKGDDIISTPVASNAPVQTKRPLHVDSVTRMTSSSNKPGMFLSIYLIIYLFIYLSTYQIVKIAKIDTTTDEAQYPVRGGFSLSPSTSSTHSSPRSIKSVTNVLELLKSNPISSPSMDSCDNEEMQLGRYKTLSSVGSAEFTIQRYLSI
jgi:hypothetical protein